MKRIILERKSISDNVISLANKVGQMIVKSIQNQKVKKSEQTKALFKEGTFEITVNGILKGGNVLTVQYIIYLLSNQEKYETFFKDIDGYANSEADPDTNTIKIVSAFTKNGMSDDFYETISHELEHLYQYAQGMEKRKVLYDKVRKLLDCGRKNIDAYYVGLSCYYSFKHEQDAFVHQFYTKLKQSEKRDGFDKFIKEYQPYQTINKAYDILLTYQDNERMVEAINYLGYSRKKFLNLIYYRLKRFNRKLYNAYCRYVEETKTLTEGNIHRLIREMEDRLEECKKRGYDVEWGLESIYKF